MAFPGDANSPIHAIHNANEFAYRIKHPKIVTHDMKPVQLFALIPNDERLVTVI